MLEAIYGLDIEVIKVVWCDKTLQEVVELDVTDANLTPGELLEAEPALLPPLPFYRVHSISLPPEWHVAHK